jgi:uncharacterized protein (TIGR03083 family)
VITTEPVDVSTVDRIGHDEAMRITAAERRAFADAIAGIGDGDWARPTDCDRWDVHGLVAHVVGSAAAQASPREFVRQVRAGRRLLGEIGSTQWWDGMNELQVRERAGRTPAELAAEWDDASARALRSRTRLPRPIAALPLLNLPDPIGRQPVRYLFDMGFTRDVWMHRIDLAEALGRPPAFDAAHDGRIVADVVAEWAATHGRPFTLELTGPAGGTFRAGTGGEHVTVDVVAFCRCLTERLPAEGLLAHPLPL